MSHADIPFFYRGLANGVFQCVYTYVEEGNYTYVLVVNLDATTDESTTYRVTCMVSYD
ncbi:hypothetical protein DPMN_035214 [Dreissena polymorpha]|uniref:Uncharacterized protein n=1 Tax=Dreissena polymorpha TaxID=45954 RepID=A0A9D4M994_DREPO|nr:hypothetical protein DPMN_035214 [Dreissena polymorpha]